MSGTGFALFGTALGPSGIAWGSQGLRATALPGGEPARLRARLVRRVPGAGEAAMPAWVARVTEGIRALLAGGPADFAGVPLDGTGAGAFEMRVWALTRTIPRGETRTYGALAEALGDAGLARAVGQALGRNPWPLVVPCHRVLAAAGRPGGFSAPGGIATKFRLLEIEGAFGDAPALPFPDLPRIAAPRRAP